MRYHTGVAGVAETSYLTVSSDFRKWCFAARSGIYMLWDKLPELQVSLGVVIEAREDEQMPERLLGCAHISRPDYSTAKPAPEGWEQQS